MVLQSQPHSNLRRTLAKFGNEYLTQFGSDFQCCTPAVFNLVYVRTPSVRDVQHDYFTFVTTVANEYGKLPHHSLFFYCDRPDPKKIYLISTSNYANLYEMVKLQ